MTLARQEAEMTVQATFNFSSKLKKALDKIRFLSLFINIKK